MVDGTHRSGPGHHRRCHQPLTVVSKHTRAFAPPSANVGSIGAQRTDGRRTPSVRSPTCTAYGEVKRAESDDG